MHQSIVCENSLEITLKSIHVSKFCDLHHTWEGLLSQLDLDVLLYLNQFLASDKIFFDLALTHTNHTPWLITTVIIVFFWFSKDTNQAFSYRKDVILLVLCSVCAFILAKPLAHFIGHARPLLLDLDLLHTISDRSWGKLVDGFEGTSSTPSDLASFLWAFCVAMFFIQKRIAALMVLLTLFVCFLAVGLGYFYPSDIVYSLLFGGGLSLAVFLCRQWLQSFCQWVLQCFEYFPAIAYPAAFMLMYDINHHMAFFQYLLKLSFGIRILQ